MITLNLLEVLYGNNAEPFPRSCAPEHIVDLIMNFEEERLC